MMPTLNSREEKIKALSSLLSSEIVESLRFPPHISNIIAEMAIEGKKLRIPKKNYMFFPFLLRTFMGL